MACSTNGHCALAVALKGQARLWSRLALSTREPYTLTHGLCGLVPGSHVEITHFVPLTWSSIENRVHQHLNLQMRDWKSRRAFSFPQMQPVKGALTQILPAMLQELLAPMKKPDNVPGRAPLYWVPVGNVWDGKGDRMHMATLITPVIVISAEENAGNQDPLVVSAIGMIPLKPSVVCGPCDVLSRSYRPGQHRMLMHIDCADTCSDDEAIAAYTILMSRVSAMADFARTYETPIHAGMLRHGKSMRAMKEHVGQRAGRWVFRHVQIAEDVDASPAAEHPCGSMDGDGQV